MKSRPSDAEKGSDSKSRRDQKDKSVQSTYLPFGDSCSVILGLHLVIVLKVVVNWSGFGFIWMKSKCFGEESESLGGKSAFQNKTEKRKHAESENEKMKRGRRVVYARKSHVYVMQENENYLFVLERHVTNL